MEEIKFKRFLERIKVRKVCYVTFWELNVVESCIIMFSSLIIT